jgi:hypothetical protein
VKGNFVTIIDDDSKKQGRGVGRPRVYASDAERKAAFLARHNLVQLNVTISAELMNALDSYMERNRRDGEGLTKGQVVEKLLRTQLLRKR